MLAVIGGGFGWLAGSLKPGENVGEVRWRDFQGPFAMIIIGSVLLSGFRIGEIIEVWAGATPSDNPNGHASHYLNKSESQLAQISEAMPANTMPLLSFNF